MNKAAEFYTGLNEAIKSMIDRVSPFRARAHAVVDGKVQIQEIGSDSPLDEPFARLEGFVINPNDEVAVIMLNGKPFVLGKIQRTAPNAQSFGHPILISAEDNQAFRVAKSDGTGIFQVDNLAPSSIRALNGVTISGHADEGGTGSKWAIDSSNGNARFDGTLNANLLGAPTYESNFVQTTSDVTSTTDTANFQTAISKTITLPTGTWTLTVVGEQQLRHSTDGGVAFRVVIGGSVGGTSVLGQFGAAYIRNQCIHEASGLSGTVTVSCQFRSSSAGTSTSRNPSLRIVGVRTA